MLVTHKASDLKPQTRAALEAEYGRPLREDEEIGLLAFLPHDAPKEKRGGKRPVAWTRLSHESRTF
jgi:hypothetical protein